MMDEEGHMSDSSAAFPVSACRHLSEGLPRESIRKALKAAFEGRLIELTEELGLYAFLGEEEDYILVEELFCSCPDFRVRVLAKRERKSCYHLLSLCLSKVMGRVARRPHGDPTLIYEALLEILTSKRAQTLRSARG